MRESILARLNRADSAETFFALLKADYQPQVLRVARLHVLRRMGQYLAAQDFSDAAEAEIQAACRETLQRAYADFVASSPLEQRVFKVLKDAVAAPPQRQTLVQLSALE